MLLNKGIFTQCFVKVKPEPYQKQDVRVYQNKVSILDQYDRAVDEFIANGAVYETFDSFKTDYEDSVII